MKTLLFISCFIFHCHVMVLAQSGFSGSGIIGLTAAQIDGDDLVGYNKLGLTAGIKVSFDLRPKISGNVEILFSQRGSSSSMFSRSQQEAFTKLNYFELPLYLSFKDWYIEKDGYYKIQAQLGLSYASLISSSGQNEPYNRVDFGKSDLSYIVGVGYSFTKKWTLTARFTRSISKLLTDETVSPEFYLLGYFWTIRAEYQF